MNRTVMPAIVHTTRSGDVHRRTYSSIDEAFRDERYACALWLYPRNTLWRRIWRFFVKPEWNYQ